MKHTLHVITLDVANKLVLGHSPNRVSITFFAPWTAVYCLNHRPMANDTDGIFFDSAGQRERVFTRDVHGSFVDGPFFAHTTTLNTVIAILEVLED